MASHYYTWRSRHYVHYERRGLGDPLVLVHNLYPGASHEEYAQNVGELSRHYTVYGLDLLGFGDSDAPRMRYTAETYIDLLHDFIRDVVGRSAKPHVMAAGLPAAYVTALADRAPDLLGRLCFLCPRSEPTGLEGLRWTAPIRHFVLTNVNNSYYDALASRYGVRQYLQGCFHGARRITDELVERLHYNANRIGSVHAYASLLTGYADHPLLQSLPRVQNEILLVWGRQARPTPVEHSVRLIAMAQHARLHVIEQAGSWVHYEHPGQVDRLAVDFFQNGLPAERRVETA